VRKPLIVLATAAVVLTVSGLRAADVWRWRAETLRITEARAGNLSHVVAQYLVEACAAADAALRQLALHSAKFGGPGAPESEWSTALATAKASLIGIGSISVADRDGVIRHSTAPRLVGQSRADDYVFTTLKQGASDDLIVDRPFATGRQDHRYVIPLGRRVLDEHGAFAGAVVATFIPEDLHPFFNAIATGPHGVIWVFHPTGVIVAREPAGQNAIGAPARGNPLFEAASTATDMSGLLTGWSDQDGRAQIGAFRRIAQPPLMVAVSLDRADALAEVRRVAIGSLTFFIAACVVIGSGLVILFRQMDAKGLAEATLQERQRVETEQLQESNRLLTNSLQREQAARQEAEAANALKDQFLMTVSHELRTPLTAIYGWARMLATGTVREQQRDSAIQTIERNARVQMRIIDDLLDAARVMNGKLRLDMRPIDAAGIVSNAVETVRPAASAKSIAVETTIEDHADVVGDGERLQQIVWNLLSNAVKFTPAGGSVSVRVRRDGAAVEIVVSDTGTGISPGFLPYVFERFRQQDGGTSRQHGGLGLGLAIVRSLVELHGGTVSAESEGTGRGSTFSVRLPARVERGGAGPSAPELPAVRPAALNGLHILVVDDEPEARMLFSTILEGAGAAVTTAASVRDALAALAATRFDVLLSDIEMPGQDGYELVAEAAALAVERQLALVKIAVSAYSRPEDEMRSLAAGFERYLIKPVDPAVLVAAIDGLRPEAVH
jgi:signal transduction histidine kinase/ActR/RegA family two-component response regulator